MNHDLSIDDPLFNSRNTRQELGDICDMTLHRWVKAGIIPEPIKIRERNYWRKSWIEQVKTKGAA